VQVAICRDSKGHIIKAFSQINPPCDANYGKALAAQLAISLKLKTFSLEGDSSVIIAELQTPTLSQDWHIESVIAATLSSHLASSTWEARKVHRSANLCTHHVAFWVAAKGFSGCISIYFPLPSSIPICSGNDPPPSLVLSCKTFGSLVF
jgi:hypothetical protein